MQKLQNLSVGVFMILMLGCSAEQTSSQNQVASEDVIVIQNSKNLSENDYFALDVKTLEQYANQNDPMAQTFLAMHYIRGNKEGITKDPVKGMALLEQVATQGHPQALFHLSEMYITPDMSGVEDRAKSKELLRKAAEANDVTAQLFLANRLQFGAYEHKRDIKEAIYWYERASANGHEGAKMSLENLKKYSQTGS